MRDRGSYRSGLERSPRREAVTSELDEHSNRIKELLRADLIMLEEENAILKAKCKKVGELEEKVEMILKQNSQLLSENERLSKLLHQKKQEYEIIKDKLEVQSSQKLEYATEFDYQRKKLLAELDALENELKEVEHIKNAQINQIKSQHQIEMQTLKRQTTSSQDVYEQEIRKLREQLDKKEYQMSDTMNRLKRFSSEAEYDIIRLKEEKQKLRNELLYVETDKKKELDGIRAKLETNYLEEIQSIKKNHLASLEGFELENAKLKDLLEAKNIELEQSNAKAAKQRNNLEETIAFTKRENEMLRNKLVEAERFNESDKDTLKVKLNKVHESEIEEMRINHQKYIDCLQSEIAKLDATINKKNAEIEQLIKEKASLRQMFDSEGSRLKEEIESLQFKIKDLDYRYSEAVSAHEEKLKEKSKHIDYLDKLNQDQNENHENEVRALKQIIDQQKGEIEREKLKSRERDQQYQETIDELKSDNHTLRDNLSRQRTDKDKQIEDITYQLEGTITTLKSKVDTLSSRNGILEREQVAMKETIAFKDREIKNLQERTRVTEQREKKLERENDELRSKLIKKDQKTNEMLDEQKKRLENTFAFTIDNLKMDHESALKLEANKQADLNDKLRRKQNELDDLLKAYKKMRDEMEALTEQEANKKEMTLKFPGATADLIATKNLFDVFLKTRVLDLCGDARDKENRER